MSSLQQETYEDLKCTLCDFYLSVPPIKPNGMGFTCGRCNPPLEETPNLQIYETLASKFRFPCSYETNGCCEMLDWNRVSEHEENCSFMTYNCPSGPSSGCKWRGKIQDMKEHVETLHKSSLMNWGTSFYFPKSFNGQANKLLVHKDMYFLFKVFFDRSKNGVWIRLFYIGDLGGVQLFYNAYVSTKLNTLMMHVRAGSIKKIWDCDLSNMEKLTYDMLKPLGKFNMSFRIELSENKEKFEQLEKIIGNNIINKNSSSNPIEELKCPKCKELMLPPIYICFSGHSLCSKCNNSSFTCPQCKTFLLKIRNYSLEKLTECLQHPCENSDKGCKFVGCVKALMRHKKKCDFNRSCLGSKECDWMGPISDMYAHIEEAHPLRCIMKMNRNWQFDMSADAKNSPLFYIIKFRDNIFKILLENTEPKGPVRCAVKHLNIKPDEQPAFRFQLEFVDQTGKGRKLVLNDLCYPLEGKDVFSKCLMLPYSLIEHFVDGNSFLNYRFTMEKI